MKTKEQTVIEQNEKIRNKILSNLTTESKLKEPVLVGVYTTPTEFTFEKAHYIYDDEGALVIKCDRLSTELDTLYTEDLLAILAATGENNIDYYKRKIVNIKTDLYSLLENRIDNSIDLKVPKPFLFSKHKLTTIEKLQMCENELCAFVKDYSFSHSERMSITGFYYDDLLTLL